MKPQGLNERPVIGITMGDPAGIGPEVTVKTLSDPEMCRICRPVVFGDPGALSVAMGSVTSLSIREILKPAEADGVPGQMDLIPVCRLEKECLVPGFPRIEGGVAMVDCIIKSTEMAHRGEIAALVTCPINKALMHQAGYPYEGHTQFIAGLTGCKDYVMMLAGERLRVALATIHCALRDVPYLLTSERIHRTIVITSKALTADFGIRKPAIAVAALNPHAGEQGLFGTEEEEIIRPALESARREGCDTLGPFPPDTLFHRAAQGEFDAVVAMYHDQGLIPLKLLHFQDAVNITLGLPIIRTSVDHGTAYEIAGKGLADPSSLKAAIRMAVRIAKNRAAAK
ncbi:MAG: 4-hydroxythreonine-4-phosphate dehydrogenase PdxA [Thermodesulfobacteriota bacterium]